MKVISFTFIPSHCLYCSLAPWSVNLLLQDQQGALAEFPGGPARPTAGVTPKTATGGLLEFRRRGAVRFRRMQFRSGCRSCRLVSDPPLAYVSSCRRTHTF